MPRLLIVTSVWPTPDRPNFGIFVANRFRGVPNVTLVTDPRDRWWPWRLVHFVWRGLRAPGPFDGVEAHILYAAGWVGLVVARLRGLPLVVYAHGTDARSYFSWGRGYRFFVRQVVRGADLLVTNSEDTAGYLRRIGREPLVIPPGYDDTLFRPSPRPQAARGRVLYLGGTTPGKGHEVAERHATTLAGPGIRDMAPAEVARQMAAHDIVMVPSHHEGFGIVALEAIASGRWVVARDVGGLRNIITSGLNGTLVGDEDWAGALATVPDYDPFTIARTVDRYRLSAWQAAMADAWSTLLRQRGASNDAG
jgi:glycosyltransferase involved in cell wall biosynthesis